MAEREISAAEVIEAVQSSERLVGAKWGRRCAVKKRGEYDLRVVFEEDERRILVITTYVTRRGR